MTTNATPEDLANAIYLSDEADCVRHAIAEVASRFDITRPAAAAIIARMYGLDVSEPPYLFMDELVADVRQAA